MRIQTDILKELRKDKNLTQADMGKHFGITYSMYSLYETGKRRMSIEMLCTLADILETSTDYILGRTDDPAPPTPRIGTREHYSTSKKEK